MGIKRDLSGAPSMAEVAMALAEAAKAAAEAAQAVLAAMQPKCDCDHEDVKERYVPPIGFKLYDGYKGGYIDNTGSTNYCGDISYIPTGSSPPIGKPPCSPYSATKFVWTKFATAVNLPNDR